MLRIALNKFFYKIMIFNQFNHTSTPCKNEKPLQMGVCKGFFVVDRGIEPLCQD